MLNKREAVIWWIAAIILLPLGAIDDIFFIGAIIKFFDNISPGNGLSLYILAVIIFLMALFKYLKNNGATFRQFLKSPFT